MLIIFYFNSIFFQIFYYKDIIKYIINMINTLFPNTIYSNIQYDDEGLYSITKPIEAEEISCLIKLNLTNSNLLNIFDGTGGLGGNTINFSKHFNHITTCEINKERYNMLVNNIDQYNLKNITKLNTDSVNYLYEHYNEFDIYFFDPPWGGPLYKKCVKIQLKIGDQSLLEIAQFLKSKVNNKILVYKIPFNYDFSEFYEFNYKIHKINKYYIIIFKFF
jgi:16S rRNA G966 N2-methylase RsmD